MGAEEGHCTRVALFGYGPRAREQAARLRSGDSGRNVCVVVRPGGMSWIHAVGDGLRPVAAREALARAEVVLVTLPEAEQPAVWAQAIAPHLAPGMLVVFTQATAVYSGAVAPDPRLDVVLVTAGDAPDACRVAVHQDATGRALDRAVAFARTLFGGVKLGTTTFAAEAQSDLSALVARMGGLPQLLAEWDKVLANPSHEPDEATLNYYEGLRAAVLAGGPASVKRPPPSSQTALQTGRFELPAMPPISQRNRGAA